MYNTPWTRYATAFVITSIIFITAFLVSDYFSQERLAQVRAIEDDIAVNILALETQFDLLAEQSCNDIAENSVLSTELSALGAKLAYMESSRGTSDPEVVRLKRYYSLLQIKDLLLMQKVSEKCALDPVFLLYFYSNNDDCPDCTRQGYVLSALARTYPKLRIYSFDYHLDLSTVRTLIALQDVPQKLPALVINNAVYTGFQGVETIETLVPELSTTIEEESLPTATTTSTVSE